MTNNFQCLLLEKHFFSNVLKLMFKNDFIQKFLQWEPWWFRETGDMSENFPGKILLPVFLLGLWGCTQLWKFSFPSKIPKENIKWQNSQCIGWKKLFSNKNFCDKNVTNFFVWLKRPGLRKNVTIFLLGS